MFRRISTRLVVAVLAAVALPFVAFAFFINEQVADRMTRHVVQQSLMGLAKEIAGSLDGLVQARRQDVLLIAGTPLVHHALDEDILEAELRVRAGEAAPAGLPDYLRMERGEDVASIPPTQRYRLQQTAEFDRTVALKEDFDLLLLYNADGGVVSCNVQRPNQELLPVELLSAVMARTVSEEPWFRGALAGEVVSVDQHRAEFLDPLVDDPAEGYQIGFAAPVLSLVDPEEVIGVLYGLVNWSHVQAIANADVVQDYFRGLVDPGERPSPYAWIWRSDADTIIGHPDRSLYGKSVARDVGLPALPAAVHASASDWGLYPEYRFKGVEKNAAFCRCSSDNGGFGWVVGIGIDNDDIYATVLELQELLLGGTTAVLLMAVLWTLVIARRTTAPILALQQVTRRVAEGDLDARIEIRSRNELEDLADDFNVMTVKLKEQRDRIVKAEKDAAWREMARQIAHDLKNPLTPIQLSLDLLDRVRRDKAEGADEILERTLELIRRQVRHLREIAKDFYDFTGGRKARLEPVEVLTLLEEVLHLHDAWAVEQRVEMHMQGAGGTARADLGMLRRVLVNLVSNALQAMPDGGRLEVAAETSSGQVRITFRDTGVGLSEEVREHLFEPYFTTKSEGTGLGLAISKRVVEEMEGEIRLEPALGDEHGGTIATVVLPAYDLPAQDGEPA